MSRHEGAYYETGWRAAVNARPSMVSVTSFNEWGEGTQVRSTCNTIPYISYFKMCSLGNTNPTFSSQIEPAVPYGRTNISYKDYRFKIRFFDL